MDPFRMNAIRVELIFVGQRSPFSPAFFTFIIGDLDRVVLHFKTCFYKPKSVITLANAMLKLYARSLVAHS